MVKHLLTGNEPDDPERFQHALENAEQWNEEHPDTPVHNVGEVLVSGEAPEDWVTITCTGCGRTGQVPPHYFGEDAADKAAAATALCSACQARVFG